MNKVTTDGVLHGDRVDLSRRVSELPDGAEVSVTITPRELSLEEKRRICDDLFGAWADDPDIPRIFEEIMKDREKPSNRAVNLDDPS